MSNPDLYPVIVRPLSKEDGGGFLATVPDLPGCMADGETEAEAMEEVREAIAVWIAAAKAHGDRIPEPNYAKPEDCSGKFMVRIPKSLHMELKALAEREGVSLNQLVNHLLSRKSGEYHDKAA